MDLIRKSSKLVRIDENQTNYLDKAKRVINDQVREPFSGRNIQKSDA